MRALVVASLAALLGVACTSELELELDGKSCREAEPRCVRGYTCDVVSNLCVLPEDLVHAGGAEGQGSGGGAGAGGASGGNAGAGNAGAGGATAGNAGAGGASAGGVGGVGAGGTTGGAGGDGGSGGVGGSAGGAPAGSGGSDPGAGDAGIQDASLEAGNGGCTPVTLYRDGDNDGFGDVADSDVRCPEDGWVSQPGDCRDDLPDVFPGQTTFFAEPYADPTRPAANNESFDYDCSGVEESAPTNSPATPAPNSCAGVLGLCQGTSGYLPSSPLRSGAGVEPRCGSNLRRTCIADGLGCAADDVALADTLIFRCK